MAGPIYSAFVTARLNQDGAVEIALEKPEGGRFWLTLMRSAVAPLADALRRLGPRSGPPALPFPVTIVHSAPGQTLDGRACVVIQTEQFGRLEIRGEAEILQRLRDHLATTTASEPVSTVKH